jgi:DNA repair protein RecN (Recombination protein N)
MLKELHIKNVVLIKDIKVSFNEGFSVFTGETGAGKSILLDSLSMALGERANFSMIGKYGEHAEITAIFALNNHPAQEILKQHHIKDSENIIIRRIISKDGKSKAFLNDTPVSVSFLRSIGEMILDIHGQFDNQKLLNPSFHRGILDSFIKNQNIIEETKLAYKEYNDYKNQINEKKRELEELQKEKDYIEYSLNELNELSPRQNEEKELLEKKQLLLSNQKINDSFESLDDILENAEVTSQINKAIKFVSILEDLIPENTQIKSAANLLNTAFTNMEEAMEEIKYAKSSLNLEDYSMKEIETRLMEIRTLAKKHRVLPDDLQEVVQRFENKLQEINNADTSLGSLEKILNEKLTVFLTKASILTQERLKAAHGLDEQINTELAHLKLENAAFSTMVEDYEYGENGKDRVVFKVKTNKFGDFDELNKIASGGEMARFMLALKSVLAKTDTINTMILDEIDIGVGGEVALAIGKRLYNLGKTVQLIVVTHSHQVASKGEHHYKVSKQTVGDFVETTLTQLRYNERVAEIARMLSGNNPTEQATATAIDLLNNKI